jgi:alkylation response protein AidB-like acyl-CoA dehydrogenase
MTVYFTEDHRHFQESVRKFATEEVAPVADELDRRMEFPVEMVKRMSELGLMGIPYPKEFGGLGKDTIGYALAVEELTKVCSSTAISMAAHISLGTFPIYKYGTEVQKKKYVPEMTSGKLIGAFGLTEPEAGSDASAMQTTAVADGDEWVINGSKIFITNGGYADVMIVAAVTDPDARGGAGISTIIVETDTSGFRVGDPLRKMGWRASDTREVFFEDVRVPKDNLLGVENRGLPLFLDTLDGGRIIVAAMGVGVAEAAFENAKKYVNNNNRDGQKLKRFQGVSFPLADMKTRIEAARHLTYNAAHLKDTNQPFKVEAAMAKLYASELSTQAATEALDILGLDGNTREYPVERLFRDAKILEIGEGTSEIQRLVIAREVLRD